MHNKPDALSMGFVTVGHAEVVFISPVTLLGNWKHVNNSSMVVQVGIGMEM